MEMNVNITLTKNNSKQVDILTLAYDKQQLQVHYTQVDQRGMLP